MAKVKLRKFDPVKYLKSEKDLALYLDACLKEGGDDAGRRANSRRQRSDFVLRVVLPAAKAGVHEGASRCRSRDPAA